MNDWIVFTEYEDSIFCETGLFSFAIEAQIIRPGTQCFAISCIYYTTHHKNTMKRILVLLSVVLFSAGNLYAQKDKQVESNLMFNSGTFFETGSYYGNINWSELFSSQRTFRPTYLLLPGHVFRISYGLDVKMNEHWSLMPGVGARVQTASLLGMFAIGGDVDVMAVAEGFLRLDRAGLEAMAASLGLAMDTDDLAFCQHYFADEGRDPTITEIRMIDTYWSDHCRHTTFNTIIDSVEFADPLLRAAWASLKEAKDILRKHGYIFG